MKSQADHDIEMCGHELTVYPPGSEPPVRFSDLVVLLRGWRERAQKCREEGQAASDQELNEDTIKRLYRRAEALDDCARELEIVMQHNDQPPRTERNQQPEP